MLLLLLLLAVAGGGGAYLLLFRGGGEPYDLPQATVATESYDYPALGVSARIPTGWDVDELSKQVIFNGYDAKSDSTVPRFRVEKSDEDLERILEEIRAAGQRGNPSAKAVLQGYLNWWEADNSHIQLKVGKVGTTAIGNQERAGVFVDTHVLGRKRMDGSSIWSRYVFEVIAVGDEWWLVQWTASTDDWAQHWPYLKGISDSLRLAG